MAKMTDEEKKQKRAEKKAAQKAKKAARKAAMLLKKKERAAKKKAKREAKKARELEKREKQKAKKLALKEKKRLAREKKRALETAKKLKMKQKKIENNDNTTDIRNAVKNIKHAISNIADELTKLDADKRAKKTKAINRMGYDVIVADGKITVKFTAEKSKKDKFASQPNENVALAEEPEKKAVAIISPDVLEPKADEPVEVLAGDLYGQDGNAIGEVANIEDDDGDEDDEFNDEDDDTIIDSRDETDKDLIESRHEFFSNFGDDFEPNDN